MTLLSYVLFSLNVFLSPILCNHESGNLDAYGDIACASLPNIVSHSCDFDRASYDIDDCSFACPTCAGKINIFNLQVAFSRILHNPYVKFTPLTALVVSSTYLLSKSFMLISKYWAA
jgi:hypothetical protein